MQPNANNLIETTQTFPSPNILQTPSTIVSSNQYQTSFNVITNQLCDFEQEQPRTLTENISNICSSSCNENSIWVSRDDDFRESRFEEGIQAQVEKEKEKICDEKRMECKEVINEKGDIEMNSCFENSNFDFGLLESVLNSEFISHDLDYMDELAWNF
jgi:myb proto-oncogene protein